ncbi:1-phosphatidylinositol-4 5-bisphosphate phosphodiesterase [Fusarium sp. NRRL 52700]|nr:1-phosphatidylinositol-4 5-bisphosphate phosphodiesterase [Fusarium sp. NRRL 52700]
MDLMSLTARDLSEKCLEAFQICLTLPSTDPGLSNQHPSHDERFEYRFADFNLWIDGIGALAPSKASLDARLSERPIDLSLVKGNLVMLFQSLEDCLNLLEANGSLDDVLLDVDSALESLVTLSLAIRKTGRRSRLYKADRLFKSEEHAELKKHLEAIVLLRPGPGPCFQGDEFQTKKKSLTPLQNHLVMANLKRRNRFIQAQLHSLGLKKRSVGFELPAPGAVQQAPSPVPSSSNAIGEIVVPITSEVTEQARKIIQAPMSVTSASIPESKLEYKEPISKRTESTPMTVITQITASARYPRPRISDNAKNNSRWRCPAPDVYYSNRSMLEQHFRQDHPPVWVCPLCDHGSVYLTMTEMMDHLHDTHAQDVGEDISAIISSSAQKRMGIESCPLCEVKGDVDSSELIDHVVEHVHDFSLRSLPWPRPSEVDIGGEVGSFNPESGEAVAINQWLEGYEHETDDHDPTLKLSTWDYGRLVIITEQIKSQKEDKMGLDIDFADEHGDESAEAETDISQLTQDTLESVGLVKGSDSDRDVVFCHECSAEWYRDENGLVCPQCESDLVEIIEPHNDPRDPSLNKTPMELPMLVGSLDKIQELQEPEWVIASPSKSSNRESTSGFRKLTDRLFSRKKPVDIEPDLVRSRGLNQKAWEILISIYHKRLDSPTKTQTMFENFIRDIQNQDSLPTLQPVSDLRSFLEVMVKFYLDPLKQLPPKDLTKPISNYFINSSYRTLLHTLSGERNAYDAIREVLYFGYRSIDLDVWNSEKEQAKPGQNSKAISRFLGLTKGTGAIIPASPKSPASQSDHLSHPTEPIVTDGFSRMTPCGFREACQVIRDIAFVTTDLPVIINIQSGMGFWSMNHLKAAIHDYDYRTWKIFEVGYLYGIQMAGIARHHVDEGMMLNEGMFANESGWVLKPNGYRSLNTDNPADPEEAPRKRLELNVFAFKDQEFVASTGREIKNLVSFMMVSLHVNDEEKPREPRQELNITEVESGALGHNLNFFVTRAKATIIPKLCILR